MRKLIAVLFMGAALTACCGSEDTPSVMVTGVGEARETSTDKSTFIISQYEDIEYMCHGPNMVYSTNDGLAVVGNDPRCPGNY